MQSKSTAENAVTAAARIPDGRNVLAIASGKGGVGKTWFAITLAHALSQAGEKTLLFDGDLGLANVDIQLGLMAERDLGAALANKLPLKKCITHFDEGSFDILAGRSGSGSLATLPIQKVAMLHMALMNLSKSYDKVIIDLGAGLDRVVRMLAGKASKSVVITTDEPTSIADAYAYIKVTLSDRPDADLRIVVNMAETLEKGEKTYETLANACSNFLGQRPKLAGIVRRDRRVRDAIRSQSPFLTRSPSAEAAEDIERVAKELLASFRD